LSHVHRGEIVTFGITPTNPETGNSYLELSSDVVDPHGTSELKNFVKKPDLGQAAQMLEAGNFFQVNWIFVKSVAALILQYHNHRSEYWIVVEGTATVTHNGEVIFVAEGQSVYVPLAAKHRM
tara:strand:- start:3143 stop:3511 length:369 start_codon:yes stop_codon:yes gene_type:complete